MKNHILLINPNTNTTTTEMMRSLASECFIEQAFDCKVTGLTAAQGPKMILDPRALADAEKYVVEGVQGHLNAVSPKRYAAVIVGAIGDPGRAELVRILSVPVVGIGEASILNASQGGRRFAMATSTPLLADSLQKMVVDMGLIANFAGVKLTRSPPLVLAANPEQQFQELAEAVAAGARNGAEAVIIAGGPLSETARRLRDEVSGRTVIVEPIPSACSRIVASIASKNI